MILLWRYEYICMFPRLVVGGFASFRNITLFFFSLVNVLHHFFLLTDGLVANLFLF
jgi:hypothetical protein